ncbi:MAG: DNA polymerase III subunit delta [Rhodospirillaceae bacterium]|nr:DNA polymerase III subunit delta [Rhodospirillaceae bacterium]MBT5458196.1 DNA polymerase III subunit delta [Rhodospirillaceae bacterium]
MKIAANAAEGFVAAPPDGVRAVLLYGPDVGLVQERAVRLARAIVDDPKDPFRIADLPAATLRADPALLSDEAAAMTLAGGRRVVRVREATDTIAGILSDFLSAPASGDALVVVEAANLGPRSKLRKAFEGAKDAAALACYADEGRSLEAVIRDTLGRNGLGVSPDAMTYLCANLGSDRLLSRAELEKLSLYMGIEGGEVSLADAALSVGDSAQMTLDDIAFAVGNGDTKKLPGLLDRAQQEGTAAVSLIRVVSRHFQRLHLVSGLVETGSNMESALKSLRPPVFFKQAAAFQAQVRRWNPARLSAALDALSDAERASKTTGMPADSITHQTLLRLSVMGRGRR